MIGDYDHFRAPNVSVKFSEGPHHRETLLFRDGVIPFGVREETTRESERSFVLSFPLNKCSADAVVARIRVNFERLAVIREGQVSGASESAL